MERVIWREPRLEKGFRLTIGPCVQSRHPLSLLSVLLRVGGHVLKGIHLRLAERVAPISRCGGAAPSHDST
jgi:hypothetical protein